MTRVSDAVKILDRLIGDDEGLQARIADEEHKLAVAQLIYDARHQAGLTQRELAALVGTRQPVIARLEDADYGAQSLAMLHRIAKALGQRLEVKFVADEAGRDCTRDAAPRSLATGGRTGKAGVAGRPHAASGAG